MSDQAIRRHLPRLARLALLVLSWGAPLPASAQQAVLLDQVVKLSRGTPNLNESEYSVYAKDFANPSPASLQAPVDYEQGRIHVRLEVLSKPSAAVTLFTLCIHNDLHQTCIRYLPKFTTPGVYEYDQPMLGQYNYDTYDFSRPVTRVIAALKDGMEGLLDPSSAAFDSFFPTEFRLTMALVAKGATYVEPAPPPRDAGTGATSDAGMSSASEDAGAPTQTDAGASAGAGVKTPVIVDQQLTVSAQSAANAKIALTLRPDAPANLRGPTDFSAGKLHARVEVLAKPSGAPTQLRACLENATGAALCTAALAGQSYVSEGAIDHEQSLASMQSAGSYDFASPLRRAYLQMTDAFGASVAGNAQFFPTDLKATFTLLAPGAAYVPPWDKRPGAGSADGGAPSSPGVDDPEETPPRAADAGRARDASVSAGGEAGAPSSEGSTDFPDAPEPAFADGNDGCALSVSDDTARGVWSRLVLILLVLGYGRRRR